MNIFYASSPKREIMSGLEHTVGQILQSKIPVIVCIGTDAVVGDSLGPLVGSMLKQKIKGKAYVFGTVDCPITAKEIECVSDFVKNAYPGVPVLAIDAALGKKEEVGNVKISAQPIKPGLGVNKDLAEIGNVSIIGVVEEKERGKRFLSSVRLSLVYRQAEIISSAIAGYIKSCPKEGVFSSATQLKKLANG
ncbi:MAG: spore protease YyaC [Clostridia bacterium]|nr:spore protease YyaC [Clostridia bacterium]